ncbi:hypothetical protein HDE_09186 [Halotydeus destructor]|nr:hypothetical protein HDE_09186 [Halotydeus destructor]
MYVTYLCALVCALATLTTGQVEDSSPAACDKYNGLTEIRCDKRSTQGENLLISNVSKEVVSFRIGQRPYQCANPGSFRGAFVTRRYTLDTGLSSTVRLASATNGTCREVHIHSCRGNNLRRRHCSQVLTTLSRVL